MHEYISSAALALLGAAMMGLAGVSRDRRRYLERLEEIKKLMWLAAERLGASTATLSYLNKRFSGAKKILMDFEDRFKGFSTHLREGIKAAVATSKLLERGWERIVKFRTLDGGVVELRFGTPIDESLYFVEISRWRMKCSCPDSVYLSSRADRAAEEVNELRPFKHYLYRYTICKHVLAALTVGVAEGILRLDDPILRRSIWLAVARTIMGVEGVEPLRRSRGIEHMVAILRSLYQVRS